MKITVIKQTDGKVKTVASCPWIMDVSTLGKD
jgi:hypothetical protein